MRELPLELNDLPVEVRHVGPARELAPLDAIQLVVAGCDAFAAWNSLRERVEQSGRWPVIIGSQDALPIMAEAIEGAWDEAESGDDETTWEQVCSQWVQAAREAPFEQWLCNQRDPEWRIADCERQAAHFDALPGAETIAELYREFAERYRTDPPQPLDLSNVDWPDDEPDIEIGWSVLSDYGAETPADALIDEAILLLLPTRRGWEAAAHLSFGGFNDCPPPPVHVAMACWAERHFGAELVGMNYSTVEWICRRPPANRPDALQLAADLLLYAEAVTLDTRKLGEMAAALKNGAPWSCWWD